jgi:hypothetical protein
MSFSSMFLETYSYVFIINEIAFLISTSDICYWYIKKVLYINFLSWKTEFISTNSGVVYSLEFSIYKIMSSAQ